MIGLQLALRFVTKHLAYCRDVSRSPQIHLFRNLRSPLKLWIADYSVRRLHQCPFIMKIDTPEFKSLLTPELQTLVNLFKKHDYEIRIAGGAVRDILMGKNPKDVDFATTATPQQMKDMFESENVRMINMKGEKHGTITARINKDNFEVTTLRIDVTTDGRHAEVEFTTDWRLDSNRRDLTINSMFLGVDGTVYDYFGGYEDLKKKRVVFVGDAKSRIKEDYLRILRYFRFYARIAEQPDDHDECVIKAITENISGLGRITGERIWMELSKILSGNYVSSILQCLIRVGAGDYIGFPKSPNIDELISVWEQAKNLNMHPVTVLVSIMSSSEEMMNFHARCKLSSFERDLGLFIIEHRYDKPNSNPIRPYQALMFKTDGKMSDIKNYILEMFKYRADLTLLHEFQQWDPPKFPINGHMLKEKGVPLGRPLGNVMKKLKEYWIEKDFKSTSEEILSQLPRIMDELGLQMKQSM